jgi:hypothetical protein
MCPRRISISSRYQRVSKGFTSTPLNTVMEMIDFTVLSNDFSDMLFSADRPESGKCLISQGFQRISVPFAFAPRHRNRAKA